MFSLGAAHDAVVADQSGSQVGGMEGSCGDTPVLVQSRNKEMSFAFRDDTGVLINNVISFPIHGCAQSHWAFELVIALPTVVE